MKVVCISDTHYQHEALNDLLPPGDMIIHAGDILDKIRLGRNVGCPVLKTKVEEIKPKLVVCGHIHENYGTLTTGTSIIVNAAIMTLQYKPLNAPILVNLD